MRPHLETQATPMKTFPPHINHPLHIKQIKPKRTTKLRLECPNDKNKIEQHINIIIRNNISMRIHRRAKQWEFGYYTKDKQYNIIYSFNCQDNNINWSSLEYFILTESKHDQLQIHPAKAVNNASSMEHILVIHIAIRNKSRFLTPWIRQPVPVRTTLQQVSDWVGNVTNVYKSQDILFYQLKWNGSHQLIYEHKKCASLTYIGITNEDYIFVKLRNKIYIYKEDKELLTLYDVDLNQSLLQLMKQIESKTSIKPIYQRLKITNKAKKITYSIQFEDDRSLKKVGVTRGMRLDLIIIPRPHLIGFESLLYSKIVRINNNKTYDAIVSMIRKQFNTMRSPYYYLQICDTLKIEHRLKFNSTIFNTILATRQKKPKIQYLYHVTSINNVSNIIHTGFNRDYNVRSKYGRGTYFASSPYKACKYLKYIDTQSQTNIMFCCRVLVGHSIIGTQNMISPAIQYDSLVDNLHNPQIYVIDKDYHAYPTHVIIFKQIQNK